MGINWKKLVFDIKTKLLDRKLYSVHLVNERTLLSKDLEGVQEINFNKRKALVAHALEYSSFYKEKYTSSHSGNINIETEEDFTKIPILTREELRTNFEKIRADNVSKKDYYKISTSGSTGPSISVLHDKRFPLAPTQWRLLQWWGIAPYENKAFIYRYPRTTIKKVLNTLLWWPTKRIFLAGTEMDEAHMRKFALTINKTKPTLIQGYIDVVYEFALFLMDHKTQIHPPKAVWVTSGPLSQQQRNIMQKTFKAPVYDQYGSTELMCVSAECKEQKGLHIMHDIVYVECLNENNQPVPPDTLGKLVLTDLHNYAFPLIRYEIGDYGRLLEGQCSCGLPLPLMDNVRGRQSTVIYTPSGIQVGGEFLISLFDEYPNFVRRFQFVQRKDYSLVLYFIPWNGETNKKIINSVLHKIKCEVNSEVIITSSAVKELTKINGKVPLIISEI